MRVSGFDFELKEGTCTAPPNEYMRRELRNTTGLQGEQASHVQMLHAAALDNAVSAPGRCLPRFVQALDCVSFKRGARAKAGRRSVTWRFAVVAAAAAAAAALRSGRMIGGWVAERLNAKAQSGMLTG